MLGTCEKFEGTFGFVRGDDDKRRIFVHFSEIVSRAGAFRKLRAGERISFTIEESERGPMACDVIRLDPPAA